MAEKNTWQKLSISNPWEHFLVPEHQMAIYVDFELGLSMEFLMPIMTKL